MITSDERRSIAERIGGRKWNNGACSATCLLYLAEGLGIGDEDVIDRPSGYIAGKIAGRIRELCEGPDDTEGYRRGYDEGFASADDWYAERSDAELLAHNLMRLPVGADGEDVRPGEHVYDKDGRRLYVCGITTGPFPVLVTERGGTCEEARYVGAGSVSHEGDTFASLADELEVLCCGHVGDYRTATRAKDLLSIAERLRRLGGGES